MECRLLGWDLKPCMESPAGECLSTVLVVTNFLAIPANRRGPHAVMAAPPSAYFAESHSLPLENLRPAWVIRFKHFFWSLDLRSCLWFEPFSDVAGWDVKHNMFPPTIRSLKRTCVCRLKRPLGYTLTIKIATTQNEDISALAYATALFVRETKAQISWV